MERAPLMLFRDGNDVQPPDSCFEDTDWTLENPYMPNLEVGRPGIQRANFKPMPVDEWLPDPDDMGDDDMTGVVSAVQPSRCAMALQLIRAFLPKMLRFIDSGPVMVVFMAMTMWALFAQDIMLATTAGADLDKSFAWVSFAFALLFAVELVVRSTCQPLYFSVEFVGKCRGPGFFFILDLLATATMYQDCMPAFEDTRQQFVDAAALIASDDAPDVGSVTQSLETGTRVGRILRLIRVVRVVKVISLLGKRNKGASEELKPSAVGKRLNELIIQKARVSPHLLPLPFLRPPRGQPTYSPPPLPSAPLPDPLLSTPVASDRRTDPPRAPPLFPDRPPSPFLPRLRTALAPGPRLRFTLFPYPAPSLLPSR